MLKCSSCSLFNLLQLLSELDNSTTENYLREVKEKASVIEQERRDLEAQIISVRKEAGECALNMLDPHISIFAFFFSGEAASSYR